MKYAIMSDAHSNPAALSLALKDARRRKCGKLVFLGDVTGYGYDVGETLKLVKANFDVVLMGNHDSICSGLEDNYFVRMNSHYDIDRAQGQSLKKRDINWLRSLAYVYENKDLIAAHGDFVDPKGWGYVFDEREAWESFSACDRNLMFCGHTHHTCVWEFDGSKITNRYAERFGMPATSPETISFRLKDGVRYIVNVGSVGYPRNDLCCSYAIYDNATRRVMIRRLPFDFGGYIRSMIAAKIELPPWIVEILTFVSGVGHKGDSPL